MNEKIAVIGGAGFIGKNLCSKLSREGLEFSVFDKKIDPSSGYDHFFLDIEDSKTLTSFSNDFNKANLLLKIVNEFLIFLFLFSFLLHL